MHEARLFIKAGHVIKNVPRGGCVKVKRAIMKVKAAYFQKGRALMRNYFAWPFIPPRNVVILRIGVEHSKTTFQEGVQVLYNYCIPCYLARQQNCRRDMCSL